MDPSGIYLAVFHEIVLPISFNCSINVLCTYKYLAGVNVSQDQQNLWKRLYDDFIS